MRKENADETGRKKRKKWPIIVVVIAILFILAAVGGGTSDDGGSGNTGTQAKNDTNNQQLSGGVEDITQDSTSKGAETELPESKGYTVGQTWQNKYLSVSYLEAGEYTDYEEYAAPDEGYKIIYAKFEFENIGSSDQVVSFTDWNCYADGYSCESYYMMDDSSSSYVETLSAGRKCKGIIAFSVPEDAKSIEFEYDTNVWTSENILFLYQ